MERSQEEHIRKNLADLVAATDCNVIFLSYLQSSGHLSPEDVENINKRDGNHERANKLYRILKQRKGAYDDLIIALRNTQQSKALSILEENCHLKVNNTVLGNSFSFITEGIANISFDSNNSTGKGRPGTFVFKGGFSQEREVAIKKMDLDYHDIELVQNEIKLLKKLDGLDNFLRVFGAEFSKNCIFIAYEFCEFSLNQCVHMKDLKLPKLVILHQITAGLAHLHSQKIVHNNLTPDNILLTNLSSNVVRVKIIGFGFSKELPVTEFRCVNKKARLRSSDVWTAPEVLNNFRTETVDYVLLFSSMVLESDIFSLGCVYYYLLTNGTHPFGDLIRGPANILDGRSFVNPTEIKEGFPDYHWLIQLMIAGNISLRPNASSLLATPLFWSNQKVSNFIEDLVSVRKRRIRNSNLSLEDTWLKVDQWALEAGLISNLTNSWIPYLCEYMQFQAHNSNYDKSSIKGLLLFIIDAVNGTFSNFVDTLVDQWITYFICRFRYLVTILWISFQEHKGEQRFSAYYNEFNDCNMDQVKQSLSSHLEYTLPDILVVCSPIIGVATNTQITTSQGKNEISRTYFNIEQNLAATYLDDTKEIENPVVNYNNVDGFIDTQGLRFDANVSGDAQPSQSCTMEASFGIIELQNEALVKTPEETSLGDEGFEIVSQNYCELDPHENKEINQPSGKSSLRNFTKAAIKCVKNTFGIGSSEKKTKSKSQELRCLPDKSNTQYAASVMGNSATGEIFNNCKVQMSSLNVSVQKGLLSVNVAQFTNLDQKIYLRWVNFNLKLENIEITDFCNDFQDGTVFLKLVSKLSGESCGEPNKTRKSKFSMKEHFRRGVQFLIKKRRFKELKTDQIVDGNDKVKEMEELVWELIQSFHLQELQAVVIFYRQNYLKSFIVQAIKKPNDSRFN
ncbi:unnamed protein product [Orchesella dallaii]|uniref:Uncharacterized protein n=1 Tax=Orchesella dallaii TaxID=48710 RepID=A0ABP1PIL6_9HEXA